MAEEPTKRRWGKVAPESYRWWQRYNRLKSEGFVHDEASLLAEGVIGSKKMLEGRHVRKKWYESVKHLGLSDKELEERVDEMYDTGDWMDPYSQFYPEEE